MIPGISEIASILKDNPSGIVIFFLLIIVVMTSGLGGMIIDWFRNKRKDKAEAKGVESSAERTSAEADEIKTRTMLTQWDNLEKSHLTISQELKAQRDEYKTSNEKMLGEIMEMRKEIADLKQNVAKLEARIYVQTAEIASLRSWGEGVVAAVSTHEVASKIPPMPSPLPIP